MAANYAIGNTLAGSASMPAASCPLCAIDRCSQPFIRIIEYKARSDRTLIIATP